MDVVVNTNLDNALPDSTSSFYFNLLRALSSEKNEGLASLFCRLHGIEQPGVILSPVYWQASHNDAMVMAEGEQLGLEEDEALELFNVLKDYFETSGYQMKFHDRYHWILYTDKIPPLDSISVYEMPGKAMLPLLEKLDPTMYWPKVITECQMLLSQQKINQLRIEKGLPTINGIWIWGEGAFAPKAISMMVEEKYLPLANACSSHVELLNDTRPLKSADILIIDSLDNLTPDQLKQLDKMNRRLFFNNSLIEKKKAPWWKRLFATGAVNAN